jgi:hypothetical protein
MPTRRYTGQSRDAEGGFLKILLLTDIPPCKKYTGGLVLDQLCRLLPVGSLACFAVVHPAATDARLSPDLDWIPIRYYDKPEEFRRKFPGRLRPFNTLYSMVMEAYNSFVTSTKIADEIVAFAREHGATALWCVLEGQTVIQLALPVSRRLNIPLFTEVWDPPQWWLKENCVDNVSTRRIIACFEDALRASKGCYAASWAMAENYAADYGVKTSVFTPSIDKRHALPPAKQMRDEHTLTIGFAGVIYMLEEWESLLVALDSVNWNIGGREVKLRVLSREANFRCFTGRNIEYLGFRTQEETIRLLSETDIQYCPYWFNQDYALEAKLSFPSKLTTYFAAGRPVFFHGPKYASPALFLKKHKAGVLCHTLKKAGIIQSLHDFVSRPELYEELARNGSSAFYEYCTLESLQKSFSDFLNINES